MKLFYFTLSYPYGLGEQWKANELKHLVKYFQEITIVPYSYAGNKDNPKELPLGVKIEGPLFEEYAVEVSKKAFLSILFSKHGWKIFLEFFKRKVYRNKNHFISWLSVSVHVKRLMDNPTLKAVLEKADSDSVLYFYWGRGTCDILPFIDNTRFRKTVVRMHRFDLFEDESDGYIPYRGALLNSITMAAPSSQAGKDHIIALYPGCKSKVEVFRCGTVDNGDRSPFQEGGALRIVSCSLLVEVKRVHLMIESLRFFDSPIEWIHIGDGKLRKDLEDLVAKYDLKEKFKFQGLMDSRDILGYYTSQSFDLFVNVSESEGVPFSIMEAFAAGIPVAATNVGGTAEIVDDTVGFLLPKDLTARNITEVLNKYYGLSSQQKMALRSRAFERYQYKCNADILANELGQYLIS